ATETARAAGAQGRFWQMHDLLFARGGIKTRAEADALARAAGLDVAQLDAALDTHRFRTDVAADSKEALALGVRATPTMFVNGRRLVGAASYDELVRVVAAEAGYARAVEAEGVARADLYESIVGLEAPQ